MDGIARYTVPDCSICPELSKVFPARDSDVSDSIAGEIDFYLNGSLRWGIELLVNGSGIGEHLERFTPDGKYAPLNMRDYAVVDLRRSGKSGAPTNVERHPNRITVFFDDNFKVAQCLFGMEAAVTPISLAE